ncbi:MAG: gliding motility lipoprotein GldH [Muribaculaceae bacterium]|nr:gliding motility lipoprotein GldH [Muribaculaceae bacterium]MDE5923709.1 gliding motility lipoprotein GldH [Muribaculaceae bacterium]
MSVNLYKSLLIPALIVAAAAASTSCRDDVDWCASSALSPEGWDATRSVDFVLDPAAYAPPAANRFEEMTDKAIGDTIRRIPGSYEATLSIRYMHYCNAETLRLVVERISLDLPVATDTLALPLFTPDGEPTGSGRLGIYESRIRLRPRLVVSNGTILSVHPIEYADTLRGITDVTLLLTDRRPVRFVTPTTP